jgi:uncharacterized protein (UPF0332 family)
MPGLSWRFTYMVRRTAYTAAHQAARAYIFECTGRVVKTHRGTHNTFFQLSSDDPRIEGDLRLFLSRTYGLKDVVDYGVGPERAVTAGQAVVALEIATRFVVRISEVLDARPSC